MWEIPNKTENEVAPDVKAGIGSSGDEPPRVGKRDESTVTAPQKRQNPLPFCAAEDSVEKIFEDFAKKT